MQNEEFEKLKTQLEQDRGPARWELLRKLLLKDQLIVVAPELDLTEVGAFIAQDNTEQVQLLIDTKKISKPSLDEIKAWEEENPNFLCLLVQPFVLIKPAQ